MATREQETTVTGDYGKHQQAMTEYLQEGAIRAHAIPNRGEIRFGPGGNLHPDILEAYSEYGFYVFEGVVKENELVDIETDLFDIMERLPAKRGARLDQHGRPALATDCQAPTLFWSKPLGDPFGGTDIANGRHPVKMWEPSVPLGLPEEVVYLIIGSLQFSEASLRLYGHPQLLRVVEAINGQDFTPFSDALFVKEPGKGASVAWHQDGTTHWDNPNWDHGMHGFNLMAQLYGSTPANGVWVVPGTHKAGKIDIERLVRDCGTERLPDAVPMICGPGDVVISNRQLLHGSFANTSQDWRVTVNMGFHRRSSVLGVRAGGVQNVPAVYDEERIRKRSRVIGYAIDARKQRFPDEESFCYQPFVESGECYTWDDDAKASMHDYNLLDLGI